MLNTITRDGATWIQQAPREEHYSARWDGGHLLLHAKRECCQVSDPVVVSPKIVQTLWEKDAAAATAAEHHDVEWCKECATRRVD